MVRQHKVWKVNVSRKLEREDVIETRVLSGGQLLFIRSPTEGHLGSFKFE
jgi:hypothetical protein